MKTVEVYTDGACSGNPGPGGWAAVLMYNGSKKEISGFVPETTNNRMELYAVIAALSALKEPCAVNLHTDSTYVHDAFAKGWIIAWQKNGWKNSNKQPVLNQDLWKTLLNEMKPHKINWVKVKGHAEDEYNNLCDKLARQAIKDNTKAAEKTEAAAAE